MSSPSKLWFLRNRITELTNFKIDEEDSTMGWNLGRSKTDISWKEVDITQHFFFFNRNPDIIFLSPIFSHYFSIPTPASFGTNGERKDCWARKSVELGRGRLGFLQPFLQDNGAAYGRDSPWPNFSHLVTKSCPTLCDSVDYSPPGSSVHRIPRQEYWGGLSFPSPGDLYDLGIKPISPALAGGFLTTASGEAQTLVQVPWILFSTRPWPWASVYLCRILNQLNDNPSPLVSDHPQYYTHPLPSPRWYLIILICLQQEFCWVTLARISLALMFPLSNFPSADSHPQPASWL